MTSAVGAEKGGDKMKLKPQSSRKLRYGGVTAALTALIIAGVIIVNVIFSALAGKFLWYTDLTPEMLCTLSDDCINLIRDGDPEVPGSTSPIQKIDEIRAQKRAEDPNFKDQDFMLTITFCDDPDAWLYANDLQRYVYDTALQLQAEFPDHIKVKNVNIVWNPTAVNQYGAVNRSSVIVECGSEFRVRSLSHFYLADSSTEAPWAYNGEKTFASLILAVTRAEAPVACLTTNHDEPVSADMPLVQTLMAAGYKIHFLDLAATSDDTEEATYDPDYNPIPEDCRLIVVYGPKNDFMVRDGVNEVDEIERLEKFLDGTNSLMVFMSPDNTEPLVNFEGYLEEWGISYDRHQDESGKYHPYMIKDPTQSLNYDGGYTFFADYYTKGLGGSVTKDLHSAKVPPKIVFPNAMSISYSDQFTPAHVADDVNSSEKYDCAISSADGVHRTIYDVFVTGENAVAMAANKQVKKATAQNPMKLLTISCEDRSTTEAGDYNVLNQASYVIACGSTEFVSKNLLESSAYGNNAFLEYAMRTIGNEPVPVGLVPKPFGDTTIDTVTTSEATQYTVVLTVLPAVLAIGSGIFVLVRRKHR